MSDFEKSSWGDSGFGQEYREKADIYVIERRRLFSILKSFYRHFLPGEKGKRVLDLGAGDGVITRELLDVDPSLRPTLIDGSAEMLATAAERLENVEDITYLQATFQDLTGGMELPGGYHFIVSSLAIHHLEADDKRKLYELAYDLLVPDGLFMNIDLVRAPKDAVEEWYMSLWREWIDERKASLGFEGDIFGEIIRRYKDNEDNRLDTLDDQLSMLIGAGFRDVDCYYKYGIFTIFGGRK